MLLILVAMTITPLGMNIAGEKYVLECSLKGVNDSILLITEIQWVDEQDVSITNDGSVTVTENNATQSTTNLVFSPLQEAHKGIQM